jgi:hypothetical protein
MTPSNLDPTAAQVAARTCFSTAAIKVTADMVDPEKKAEWKEIADASNGRYKTACESAFANYYIR